MSQSKPLHINKITISIIIHVYTCMSMHAYSTKTKKCIHDEVYLSSGIEYDETFEQGDEGKEDDLF